jgi:hypothetical protein
MSDAPAEVVEVDEVVEASSDLVPVAAPVGQVSIYASQDPAQQLAEARARAKILVEVVTEQGLALDLGGSKPHVNVEGWQFLASQFGLIPDIEWTKPLNNGWEARCALRRLSDNVAISHAEAECRTSESNWANSDSYAVRSMAETRAVSKVCRVALSSVMVMAGFAATPSEEMSGAGFSGSGSSVDTPASPDDPHCPACLAVNGELVGVSEHTSKPFWRCSNEADKCGGKREYKGKFYSWSGWHKDLEKSSAEWLNDSGHAGPRTVEVGKRGNYWKWVLDEIGKTINTDDVDTRKAMARTALFEVIVDKNLDLAVALGEKDYPNPEDLTDDHLAAVAVNLTADEAQLVVSAAVAAAGDGPA